jgi:centromeric protein E
VYRTMCEDIVRGSLDGVNGTVFAYGQTSSGKTHTIRGTQAEPGVVGLSIAQVFAAIRAASDREYLLRVSYMEIYNERVRDLLSCNEGSLALFEDARRGGCYVAELHEEVVTSEEQVEALLEEGEQRRHIARTAMNDESSRSHTIVRLVIECSHGVGVVRVGTLNLVDLAGSERLKVRR